MKGQSALDAIHAEEIKQRVVRRYKQRLGFLIHLAAYIGGSIFFWGIWFLIESNVIPAKSPSDHFLWPLIIMLLWGIALLFHGIALIVAPHFQESQDRAIAREIERAMARFETMNEEKPKRGTVRLSDDGELVGDEEFPKHEVANRLE